MSIRVSYLLPSYNHAHYVEKMLHSIKEDIKSSDLNAEIIVVDDASTDNSVEVINNWIANDHDDLNIIFLPLDRNCGVTAALNLLVSHSTGEFIRLTSSDDLLIAGSTKLMYKQFELKNDLLCVLGDGEIINEHDSIIASSSIAFHRGNVKSLIRKDSLTRELIQRWCVAGPSFLIKKAHLERVQYNEKEKIDDYQLFLSLLELPESVLFINKKVCLYRVHSTNTSKTKNVASRIENLVSFLSTINHYIQRNRLREYLFPVKYKTMAKICFLQKNYFLCSINLVKSFIKG